MNVIAGISIGLISKTWIFCIVAPFIWGVIHCLYGYIFKLHINPATVTTKVGRPMQSYYYARYFTGTITSLLFAVIVFLFKTYVF